MTTADRLARLAELWTSATSRSLARLATIVANDGKLFERMANGGSCTIATFDRFIVFFSTEANWPAGIPAEAQALISLPAAAA